MGSSAEGHGAGPNGGVERHGPIYLFQERCDKKRSKTYDNDGRHFVTEDGTVVAYTRCWKWQKGFQGDPTTKERTDKTLQSNLAAITLEVSEGGASGMEHSSTRQRAQPAATTTATNRPDRPDLHGSEWTEQDVLQLIPRGLGLVQVEDGHWL